jgi:hypothetical protein
VLVGGTALTMELWLRIDPLTMDPLVDMKALTWVDPLVDSTNLIAAFYVPANQSVTGEAWWGLYASVFGVTGLLGGDSVNSYDAGGAPLVTITPGVFYHVVATYDGSAQRLYVNGALVNTSVLTLAPGGGAMTFSADGLLIGRWDRLAPAFGWNGAIDEVAIYPVTLTDEQIASHYAAGIAWTIPTRTVAAEAPRRTVEFAG